MGRMLEIVSWWVWVHGARARGGGTSVVVMLLCCIDEVCMMTWSGSRVEIRVVVGSRAGLMVGLWVGSMVGLWVGSW